MAELTPAELKAHASGRIARNHTYIESVSSMRPIMDLLGLHESEPGHILDPVAMATLIAEKIEPEYRAWFGAVHIDAAAFEKLHGEWIALSREETELRTALPAFREATWPADNDLESSATALRKTGLGKLFGAIRGEGKAARQMSERFGIADSSSAPDLLQRVAKHVRSVEKFTASDEAAVAIGTAWAGMETPFRNIDAGLKLRVFLERKLAAFPAGDVIAAAVVALRPEGLGSLSASSRVAASFRTARARLDGLMDGSPMDAAAKRCDDEIASFKKILEIDADGKLSSLSVVR